MAHTQPAPISCLTIFILSTERQGGTLPNALAEFATWPAMKQRSFLSTLKQCIDGSGLLWMEGKRVSDPETYAEFLMRAKNPFKSPLPTT
jgi:hypothetical protein